MIVKTKTATSTQRQTMLEIRVFLTQDFILKAKRTTEVMKKASIGKRMKGDIATKTTSAIPTPSPSSGVVAELASPKM